MITELRGQTIATIGTNTSDRLLLDHHGCMSYRRDGRAPEYIDKGLTDEELKLLQDLVSGSQIEQLKQLTGHISKKMSHSYNLRVSHPENLEEVHEQSYFEPYFIPDNIKEAFSSIAESPSLRNYAKATVASGTPICCSWRFVERLKEARAWDILDPDHSVFCAPHKAASIWPSGKIFSSGSKMAAFGVCKIMDGGKNPWAVVEDIIEMAEYYAHFYDARVIVPISYEEAQKRRRFGMPQALSNKTDHGSIEFGRDLSEVVFEYADYLKSKTPSVN